MEGRLLLTTYVVTSVNDSGTGSLRQAILNANTDTGTDTITFNISGSGIQTINPATPLPAVTNPVVIDGTSQPGFSGSPLIELAGTNAGPGANGLTIAAGSSTVRGLVIDSFKANGIALESKGSNVIAGNYIGTDVTGTVPAANGSSGVNILSGSNNVIGGTTPADRNLLSGNAGYGLAISGSNTQVLGNFIGTDVSGFAALGNTSGIYVFGSNNTIGGTVPSAGNFISGNTIDGVYLPSGSGNVIQANVIGTDVSRLVALPNGRDGIHVASPAGGNTIGGLAPGAGNLISGNSYTGVSIASAGNQVQGNWIGVDATGGAALANANGVNLSGSSNLIAANVISANSLDGLSISGASNTIQANLIGTNTTGTVGLGNNQDGIYLTQANGNLIGGAGPSTGNIISANGGSGINLQSGSNNVIQGNVIGADITAANSLGNGRTGVYVAGSNNTIGGTIAGAGNVIFYNGGDGVAVDGATGDAIQQNSIGLNGGLGIDLLNNGDNKTAAPVLTAVTLGDGTTTIDGTLASTPSTAFTIELFVNNACNPSGFGDGEVYLGAVTVTTDANGFASFSYTVNYALDPTQFVSATATDSQNNTSGFAQCLAVE
jgi:hypothetical protein